MDDDETTVGIRDLRDNLRDFLRRAESGETIVVTDRGRPVAHLVPVPAKPLSVIEQAIADGRMTVPVGWPDNIPPLPPPLKLTREELGGKLLSEILQEMRDEEYR